MNHIETLLGEWLENRGYIVTLNNKVGRLPHGGWAGELDVVAFHPTTAHLVHYEPSTDGDPWPKREERFQKKFLLGRKHVLEIPQLSFLKPKDVEEMEQIAVFAGGVANHRRSFCGRTAIGLDEILGDIRKFVLERGPVRSNAFPESYPMLRTMQLVLCGYNRPIIL